MVGATEAGRAACTTAAVCTRPRRRLSEAIVANLPDLHATPRLARAVTGLNGAPPTGGTGSATGATGATGTGEGSDDEEQQHV